TQASKEIANTLIENGAKKFAFVGGGYSEKAQDDAIQGLESALEEAGLDINDNAKYVGNETYKDGSKAYETVSQANPDAILCISDEQELVLFMLLKMQVLKYLKNCKLSALITQDLFIWLDHNYQVLLNRFMTLELLE